MKTTGIIKRIIGPVVDVAFENDVPSIYSALTVKKGNSAVVLEVEQHIGENTVRTVAMDSTDGLSRGMEVVNTGIPISVPVGKETLGRIFNVLGVPIDNGKAIFATVLPIHRKAPEFISQSTKVEILETGIKVIDLICPVLKG